MNDNQQVSFQLLAKPIHLDKVVALLDEARLDGFFVENPVEFLRTEAEKTGSISFDDFKFPVRVDVLRDEAKAYLSQLNRLEFLRARQASATSSEWDKKVDELAEKLLAKGPRLRAIHFLLADYLSRSLKVTKDQFAKVSNRLRQRKYKNATTYVADESRRKHDLAVAASVLASSEFKEYVLSRSERGSISSWLFAHVYNAMKRTRDAQERKGIEPEKLIKLPSAIEELHTADGVLLRNRSKKVGWL